MEIAIPYKPNPLLSSSTSWTQRPKHSFFCLRFPTKLGRGNSRRRPIFRANPSDNLSGSSDDGGGFSWVRLTRSFQAGAGRFWEKLGESVKKETGFDSEQAGVTVGEFVGRVKDVVEKGQDELTRFRNVKVPEFVDWNRWENWKGVRNWDSKRVAALIVYAFAIAFSCQRVYVAIQAPRLERERRELTEAYMEALIPEPTPGNIERFKKGIWRKTTPKGLKLKRFIERPDGTLVHDSSYVGEKAWDDDLEATEGSLKQIIDGNAKFKPAEKKKITQDLGISG